MRSLLPEDGTVALENASDRTALLAVQGPSSRDVLKSCPLFSPVKNKLDELAYYHLFQYRIGADEIVVSRTGYTGELGYEVFIPNVRAREFWDEIASHGKPFGLQPVGLAARDTLRFEASFCLYGHELDDKTTPLEAGLGWVVKLKKGDFVGRDALVAEKEAGPKRKLIGLELEERNIARQDYAVMRGVEVVGRVTSGTFSPTLEKSLAMAYVDRDRLDDAYTVQVRKKLARATATPLPFYPSRAK
jgi:aminomethyltransferase